MSFEFSKVLGFYFILFLFIYSYVHTQTMVWVISPPAHTPSLSPPHPLLPGRTCSALISNFVEEKT
jgi:hypothetical protein